MSADLTAKVAKLEQLKARASATIAQYPQGLTAEKDLEVDVLITEAKTLQGEIERERALEAKRADLGDLDKFLNEPEHKLPHGVNGDSDDRKALLAAGWEIKGGICHKQTSVGTMQAMFPEEVLFGDIPTDDANTAQYYKTTRAAMAPEYKTAYAKFLTYTARFGEPSMAMQHLSMSEQKALSEGSDVGGGFLVPPDVQAEVLSRVAQQAVMRRHARVVTTNRDKVRFPAVTPNTTSSSSIYSSGFVGGWVGETPTQSDTDPAFQLFDIDIKKLRVSTKLSNDFIADAAMNVLAWLAQNGAENMALVEDLGFISGLGTPLVPLGILNTGLTTKDVEGSTTNTISNTTANTGSAPKLVDLVYAVPAQYRSRASWLMCSAIAGKVFKLIDANGRFYWNEMAGSGFGTGGTTTLFGHSIDYSDFMPDDGTDGNKVLLFGDLSQYVIAQRAQITTVILRERYADNDQVGLIMFERVGGALWNTDALRLGIV